MFKVGDRVKYVGKDEPEIPQGSLGTVDDETDDNGKPLYTVVWDDGDYNTIYPPDDRGFYATDLVSTAAVTYKPGDKIVATCEHGLNVGMPPGTAKPGDLGELKQIELDGIHRVMFNGEVYWCKPEFYTLHHSTTPVPRPTLSCLRCHEPNQYAEANLPGGGYACYSCRKYHAYAL